MVEAQSNYDEQVLDLADVIQVVRRRFRLILIIFSATVMITAALSFLIPPTYEGLTTLRIKQSKSLDNSLLANPHESGMGMQKLLSTYAEIIRSRTVIDTVIAKTQSKRIRYEKMLSRITIEPVKDTEILRIKVEAESARKAMFAANILVDTFLVRLAKLVRSEETAVGDFIDSYLISAKQDLDSAEQALEKFKRDQRITAPDEETKALLNRVSGMNQLKAENSITLAAAQAKLEAANRELSPGKNELIPDSPLIGQYKTKLADLEVELVGLLHNDGGDNPQVAATRTEIEDVRTKLNAEISRVVNTEGASMNPVYQNLLQGKLQASLDVAAANAQGAALRKITASAEEEIGKLPAREQQLVRLTRNVSLTQEIYVMLMKRRGEAKISELMVPTDVQIVDRAVLPDKPAKPNKLLNIVVAAFLGLFAGVGLAFWLESMNASIYTADDVTNYLNLPVLGNIPDFEKTN
jgi:succinoglycan biosynthesis transport protein ExoP